MSAEAKKYHYSEIFNSIQGEGMYTGQWTMWLRFYLCNLQCDGFGQDNPTDPDSWELPYEDFDASQIKLVEDLPVWDKGCDSSYTWAKKYKHLMTNQTSAEIYEAIKDSIRNEFNPDGLFKHPVSNQIAHMCFTGGEPLLKNSQKAFIEIYSQFKADSYNIPSGVTFETNGTTALIDDFKTFVCNKGIYRSPLFFSVSPKLWTVAGEKSKKAIKPDIVRDYQVAAELANREWHMPTGQLKFVMGARPDQWEELDHVINQFRKAGVTWPVYIMPVGATLEEQELTAGDVAKMAFERGYNVSGRLHCYLFGNAIGT